METAFRVFDKHYQPVCPHCHTPTNFAYRGYPALNCWSCGKVMWFDESGRTIQERGACEPLVDTPGDAALVRLLHEGKIAGVARCISPSHFATKEDSDSTSAPPVVQHGVTDKPQIPVPFLIGDLVVGIDGPDALRVGRVEGILVHRFGEYVSVAWAVTLVGELPVSHNVPVARLRLAKPR